MKRSTATIIREYGPFPDVAQIGGVSYDGNNIWIATGDTLDAIDADSGKTVRKLDLPAHAGTAFDGRHLFQLNLSNTQGTTYAQLARGGFSDTLHLGFILVRKFY